MTTRLSLSLLCLLGCQYDVDAIYEHEATLDGGTDADISPAQPQVLVDLWRSSLVDADCRACAVRACADIESACRSDATCLAFTECVAGQPDPAGLAACRARFASWVASDPVRERDLGGPYAQCVFRNQCAEACSGTSDLECMSRFAWPMTTGDVPLHLFLTRSDDQTKPFPNIRVRVCEARTSCETPLGEGTTDARGLVELRLPTSYSRAFTGYFQLDGPQLYPTLLKFGWNIGIESTPVVIGVERSTFDLSIMQAGERPNLDFGMLQMRMYGCNGFPQKGIRFAADRATPLSRFWYLNPIPDTSARETGPIGAGGIVDVPAGETTARAFRVEDDRLVAETEAPVRPGYMTVIVFAPLAAQ